MADDGWPSVVGQPPAPAAVPGMWPEAAAAPGTWPEAVAAAGTRPDAVVGPGGWHEAVAAPGTRPDAVVGPEAVPTGAHEDRRVRVHPGWLVGGAIAMLVVGLVIGAAVGILARRFMDPFDASAAALVFTR